MKKIVKLLAILIVLCGVVFAIVKIVDKPENLNFGAFVNSQNETVDATANKLTNIKTKFNLSGENYATITFESDIFEEINVATNVYFNLLGNSKFDNNQIKSIKKAYENLKNSCEDLVISIDSLDSYLTKEDVDAGEIDGREKKVCEKLKVCVENNLALNLIFENLTENKTFGGKSFDLTFKLIECKTMMIKSCRKAGGNNFAFISEVNDKILKLIENNQNANNEMIKFVVLFNNFDKNDWQGCFDEYFSSGSVVSCGKVAKVDFENLLSCLNKESYYEEV